ncbi:AAA family ATPase [Caulobacter segnis]|uniref:AAA family ATPase n=1 Tax=Caulobacter segnis TaxID=88688 RepID=UPI00286430C0|nr:AAA family ATPase [Caulobacter segnis]MDR6624313.1 class 3 adenylate cyclase [Caulobacter segnis]
MPWRLLARTLEAEARCGEAAPFAGALLFADIVGSTAMTDRFSARGAREVERLGAVLSAYFATCIAVIERLGGEVARIDGDAIIAIWPENGAPSAAVARAMAAAEALRASTAPPFAGEAAIRHRLAVDFGPLQATTLGEPGARRFLVLTGAPLTRMAAGTLRGAPGEVLVSREAARRLAGVTGETAVSPVLSERGGRLPAGWVDFVPPAVKVHDRAGDLAWLPEFRQVTAGYLKLGGLGGDRDRLARAYALARGALDDVGIPLSDVIVGDKGVVFKLTCGLPPHAREDNALAAAEALTRVQAKLREVGERSAAGLASGPVFSGLVGGPTRREFIAVGSVMNYGARLMEAAGRGMICDTATAGQIARAFDLGPARDLALSGRDAPLTVRRVIRPRVALRSPGPPRARAPLVGRRPERGVIVERLEAFAAGVARPLLVEGEPGVGKSRLLIHAGEAAAARGLRVVASAAHPLGRNMPFSFWRAVIPKLYGARSLRRAVEAALVHHPDAARLDLLEDVLPLGVPIGRAAAEMEGAPRREAIERLLVALVRRAPAPCVLIVDDLQWLDAASAGVFASLVTGAGGPLVLAAGRPNPGAPYDAVFSEADRSPLARLDREGTVELVRRTLDVDRLPQRLADHLWRGSGGLPLLAEQLALALRDTGQIAISGRRSRIVAAPLRGASAPDILRDVIIDRVDRLGGDSRILLKVASVIGQPFELALLAKLEPMPRRRMMAAAAQLVAGGFLERDGHGRLAFGHGLVRDCVYELLTFEQRARLHANLAERLEGASAVMAGYGAAEIAEHWERAGRPGNAIEHWLRAAEFALARYASEDALDHLARTEAASTAAKLSSEASQPLRRLKLRADALQELSRLDEAAVTYRDCARVLGLRMPRSPIGRLAEIVWRLAARTMLPRIGGLVSRPYLTSERDRLAAHLYMRIAEHAYFANDALGVLHGTVAALDHAERAGSPRETALGYGGLAIGFGVAGLDGVARGCAVRCLTASRAGGRLDQGLAHLMFAVYGFSGGHWAETADHCREGAMVFAGLGETFRRQSCETIGAFVSVATGELAEAERALTAYGPAAAAVENAAVRAWVLAGRASLDIVRGRTPRAKDAAMDGVSVDELHAGERLMRLGLLAARHLRRGDRDAAGATAAAGLLAMQATAPTIGIGFVAIPQIADVLATLAAEGAPGVGARAHAACRAVRGYARKIPAARPRAELAAGRLALAEGRVALARQCLRRGMAAAQRLRMPLEETLCRSMLAEVAK